MTPEGDPLAELGDDTRALRVPLLAQPTFARHIRRRRSDCSSRNSMGGSWTPGLPTNPCVNVSPTTGTAGTAGTDIASYDAAARDYLLMLPLADGTLVLAATDLTNHLACAHLTQQRLAIARGERAKPRPADDPHAELIRERGERHEAEQLARLSQECGGHVDLSTDKSHPFHATSSRRAAAATAAAMRDGAPLIYQAQFFDGRWQGRADFLRRVETPSQLGAHAYEVLDTKLARQIKPSVVHQLSLYNRLLAEIQGFEPDATRTSSSATATSRRSICRATRRFIDA